MKPEEFWNNRFKDNQLYCEMQLIKMTEDYKQEIQLMEATTDKLLCNNPNIMKKPKKIRLIKIFEYLFKQEEKPQQTPEEQAKILRGLIKPERR